MMELVMTRTAEGQRHVFRLFEDMGDGCTSPISECHIRRTKDTCEGYLGIKIALGERVKVRLERAE
jgi:hypothetical protein